MNSCASGFISNHQVLEDRTIAHRHVKAIQDNIVVVLRDPVTRFISLLNYRQKEKRPRKDWRGLPFHEPNSVVIDAMSDEQMHYSFHPYDTMHSYVHNQKSVRFLCSLLEMQDFVMNKMHFSGCAPFPHSNPSEGAFGGIRKDQEARIRAVYRKDVQLWNTHCGTGHPMWNATTANSTVHYPY